MAVAVLAVVAGMVGLPVVSGNAVAGAAPSLPAGFTRTALASGLPPGQLTDFAFLPGGGMLTAGKSGAVVYVATDGRPTRIHLVPVDDRGDYGLLGIELANDYAVSGHLFTHHTYVGSGGSFIKVSRWTAVSPSAPTALVDETAVLDGISMDAIVHQGGTVLVAPDDTLWVTVGESASHVFVDALALRAQDRNDPHGKIFHVYPDGTGVPTNPFFDASSPDAWASRVYALGFRSPFRLTLRPGTEVPYMGDVGWSTQEELNVVRPGGNYGWPCWEGSNRTPGYRDFPQCQALYDGGSVVAPLWSYPHSLTPGGTAAVTGGIFYTGSSYPSRYQGAYFFGDYARSQIWTLTTDQSDALVRPPEAGNPATTSAAFGSEMGGPVRFRIGPDEDVYYADIYNSTVWRLRYAAGNRAPVAEASGIQTEPGGSTVAFRGDRSHDLDGDALRYSWDFGDGTPSVQGANPTHTYTTPGRYTATLTVTDTLNASSAADVVVVPGNHAPALTLTAPPPGATYAVGERVELSAAASDVEDGPIAASGISWTENLLHCPDGVCHLHPGTTGTGSTFSTPFSDHGSDTRMEITATVTDAAGVATSQLYTALPEVHALTVAPSTPGVVLEVNDSNTAAQTVFHVTAGSRNSVAAPLQHGDQVFTGWSDGGARNHTVTMPGNDLVLTAQYLTGGIAADVDITPATGIGVGTSVRFDIRVHLPAGAEAPLSDVAVSHSACTPGTPVGDDGDGTLEPAETWTYACTRVMGSADLPVLRVATEATGTTAAGAELSATTTSFVPRPSGPIEQHYFELGGPASFLGAPTSPETAIAGGRFRHYTGGSIYWSPATGAHEVHGLIRDKWAAMGWERSILGFPVSDEIAVPGGRVSLFQGGAIYWSPATGAREVHGEIHAQYAALGGPASGLGLPVTDESVTPDGVGRYNHFERGSVYWSPATGAWEVRGDIRAKWASLGWERSVLRYPVTNETGTPDGVGRYNHFQGGSVYWSQPTGAHEVHGLIRDRWASLGWEGGVLRYPVTDEMVASDGVGRFNHFEGGSVYWSPATGAHDVRGLIRDKWASLGWEVFLGYPVSDELPVAGGRASHFQRASIFWSAATGAHEVHGSILTTYLGIGGPGSALGLPTSDEYAVPGGRRNDFQRGFIFWNATTGAVTVNG